MHNNPILNKKVTNTNYGNLFNLLNSDLNNPDLNNMYFHIIGYDKRYNNGSGFIYNFMKEIKDSVLSIVAPRLLVNTYTNKMLNLYPNIIKQWGEMLSNSYHTEEFNKSDRKNFYYKILYDGLDTMLGKFIFNRKKIIDDSIDALKQIALKKKKDPAFWNVKYRKGININDFLKEIPSDNELY